MVESEIWPNLIYETHRLGIPIGLMNARLSPRSGRRLKKFRSLVSPFLELLDYVGVPEKRGPCPMEVNWSSRKIGDADLGM